MKQGRVRLQKEVLIERTNYWPHSATEWVKQCSKKEERRKVMDFTKDQYFGCMDVKNSENKLYPGNFLSDEDSTTVLLIPNKALAKVLAKIEFDTIH